MFDPNQFRILLQLFLAVVLGGFVGYEREHFGKAAGVRTNALVALGATLFTILSRQGFLGLNTPNLDPARIASQIVVGVGFLGAGVIIFQPDEHRVRGLTTAATLWVVASIGMAIGAGFYATAIFSAILVFVVLDLLARFKFAENNKK